MKGAQFCASCGTNLGSVPDGGVGRAIKVWLVGGLVGSGTGVAFITVHDAFTNDLMFDLWEFGVTLLAPALVAIGAAKIARLRVATLVPIAYMTLLIPVLGPAFGGTGSEPLWEFALLGFIGGLVWSTPFSCWAWRRRDSRK